MGGVTQRSGIIAAANYEARKFGIKSAMNTSYARKLCPHLIVLPSNMRLYQQVSRDVHSIFRRYSDVWEAVALDEAWGDLTYSNAFGGSASLIAQAIRRDILNETGLNASAGVAPNKFLAKMACSHCKPNGFYCVRPEDVESFISSVELSKINGVGKSTLRVLHEYNMFTTADVRNTDISILKGILGQFGEVLLQRSYGIDSSPVTPFREPKSIGVSKTIACDIYSPEESYVYVNQLFDELVYRVLKANAMKKVVKISVRLRFSDFVTTTMQTSALDFSLSSMRELINIVWRRTNGRGVRLLGLSVMLSEEDDGIEKSQISLPL